MDLTYKSYPAEIVADETSRTMTFTISTGAVDRDNDTVDPKGWQLDNYRKNPQVLFAHDYHALPVAKTVDIRNTDTALIARAEFPAKGTYPFADTVYDMLKGGFLNATSVGFRSIEHTPVEGRKGFHYAKQELMEWSIVPIPSNPEALVSQRSVTSDQVQVWTKAVSQWAAEHQPLAQKAIQHYAAKTGKILRQTASQYEAFETDFLIESEDGTVPLSDTRLAKLLDLHGIKDGTSGPESADGRQAAALRLVHHAAMDAYANAHHADAVMVSMATMEANIPTAEAAPEVWKAWQEKMSGKQKEKMDQAHGAVKRARDHAMEAANHCAMMGGKALEDLVAEHKAEATANAEQAAQTSDHELWLELADDDPNLMEIDEHAMTDTIAKLVAEEAGAQVRAALNAALGRLD